MTGGVAYVWDPKAVLNRYLAETAPANRRLLEMERLELHALVDAFFQATASPVAGAILDDWQRQAERFWVLRASKPIALPEPEAVGAGAASSR
jgi:glutamate synthase domain-containing protein 3